MKKLIFVLFVVIFALVLTGCVKEKTDQKIIFNEVIPKIEEAFSKNDGNLYLEQISADAPGRKTFIELAIGIDKKYYSKIELEPRKIEFYTEEGRKFAKVYLVQESEKPLQKTDCDYIFRKERLSWKLFAVNCEN